MSRSPHTPSRDWKRDALDVVICFVIVAVMLYIGISSGQTVFMFMAGAMVLIGGGEALRYRSGGASLFLVRVGRVGMLASLAYMVFVLVSGGGGG